MKFSIYMNQQFCIDNNLSLQEAVLLSAICESPTWANEHIENNSVWYWISKSKLMDELPILKSWESFKKIKQSLRDKGFIDYSVSGNKQIFRLTENGKQYSRGKILPQQGEDFTSVLGEDFTPNNNTINPNTNNRYKTKTKQSKELAKKPEQISEQVWKDFLTQRKSDFTKTALNGIIKQAELAGWSLEQALTESVERGWQSFKAEWVNKPNRNQSNDLTLTEMIEGWYE